MAPAPATRAPGGAAPARLISKGGFLVPRPIRLPRRAGGGGKRAVVLGVGRRDGWGNDKGWPSSEGGRLVDEDMATLRRRIREAWLQAMEEDGIVFDDEDALPAGLTELERQHRGSYVEVVRCAVGLLEAVLVSARPGLGVPALLFLACAHLIQAAGSAVWSR